MKHYVNGKRMEIFIFEEIRRQEKTITEKMVKRLYEETAYSKTTCQRLFYKYVKKSIELGLVERKILNISGGPTVYVYNDDDEEDDKEKDEEQDDEKENKKSEENGKNEKIQKISE